MDQQEYYTKSLALLERIAKGLESRPAAKKSTGGKRTSSGGGGKRDDGPTVGEHLSDTSGFGEFELGFGKHSGTPLKDIPVSYIQWLANDWKPKGYPDDKPLSACIAAVMGGARASGAGPSDDDVEDDVPF